jgi:hypothetical protein
MAAKRQKRVVLLLAAVSAAILASMAYAFFICPVVT